jgi:Tol biopolymer transport system component
VDAHARDDGAAPVDRAVGRPARGTARRRVARAAPDGRRLAFQAADDGGRRAIWVHSLATGESRPVEGTGNISTSSIIWSADSRYVGFVSSDGLLKKIRVEP